MHATPRLRPKPKPARIASWARLWLRCIAALLTCAAHLLPPALQRRLPILDLPLKVLARHVARLIFLCALFEATPPKTNDPRRAGHVRAILGAGVQRHLINTHGAFDAAKIARTWPIPTAPSPTRVAALESGLARRRPILPRAASGPLRAFAPIGAAAVCDTS